MLLLLQHLYLGAMLLLTMITHGSTAAPTGDRDRFIYNGFAGANLTLDGVAAVTPAGLLVLTNGCLQSKGHAFHPSTLPFRDPNARNATAARSFSTTFVFAIYGQYADLSSNGLAFVVAADRAVLSNAMPGRNHVGVDVNSLKSINATDAGYYEDDGTEQFQNLSLISRKPMQVWVDYDGAATQVTVTMAPLGLPRPKTPLLQASIDLSDVVRAKAHVGFSSATSSLVSRHFVLGWSFALDGPAPALNIAGLPALPPAGPKPRSKVLEIVLPVASAALVLAVGIAIYTLVRRRIKYAELREDWELAFGPHRFAYKDLFHATSGFSDKKLLGAGGFGSVYKGVLRKTGMEVAVKKVSHESKQGLKEFISEVVSMGRLRHRNLVQLLGYCRRKGKLLLIYDYMPNGSLDRHLYDQSKSALDWPQRFHIIRGVASGLLYLHDDWEQVVIHRDVKASNVLIDGEMNGRLGDFGLARLYDHGSHAHTTHVMGTMGYLAPELGHTGKATPATDVFSFGAFLLEVTCGRRPVEKDGLNNRVMLVDWVLDNWRKGSIIHAVDTRIPDGYNLDEASFVLKLGLLCSHPLPSARPTMRQVVQYLDGAMVLPNLSPAYLGFTTIERMYNSEFNQNVMSCVSYTAMSDLSGGR
ncbi:hypothetical protein PR202_ga29402 [Eleusine coracana subsp. coracana]|uniref:non-specific serine/threonine protein kinase n=1 Tax=Eleusine coracana subsp. coracana TaxID=191504 RepID=A0AAV5DLT1_ELECO|nr:hypothetical protein PR202_ga29402 [Eleusine coracana subsp. coracana]